MERGECDSESLETMDTKNTRSETLAKEGKILPQGLSDNLVVSISEADSRLGFETNQHYFSKSSDTNTHKSVPEIPCERNEAGSSKMEVTQLQIQLQESVSRIKILETNNRELETIRSRLSEELQKSLRLVQSKEIACSERIQQVEQRLMQTLLESEERAKSYEMILSHEKRDKELYQQKVKDLEREKAELLRRLHFSFISNQDSNSSFSDGRGLGDGDDRIDTTSMINVLQSKIQDLDISAKPSNEGKKDIVPTKAAITPSHQKIISDSRREERIFELEALVKKKTDEIFSLKETIQKLEKSNQQLSQGFPEHEKRNATLLSALSSDSQISNLSSGTKSESESSALTSKLVSALSAPVPGIASPNGTLRKASSNIEQGSPSSSRSSSPTSSPSHTRKLSSSLSGKGSLESEEQKHATRRSLFRSSSLDRGSANGVHKPRKNKSVSFSLPGSDDGDSEKSTSSGTQATASTSSPDSSESDSQFDSSFEPQRPRMGLYRASSVKRFPRSAMKSSNPISKTADLYTTSLKFNPETDPMVQGASPGFADADKDVSYKTFPKESRVKANVRQQPKIDSDRALNIKELEPPQEISLPAEASIAYLTAPLEIATVTPTTVYIAPPGSKPTRLAESAIYKATVSTTMNSPRMSKLAPNKGSLASEPQDTATQKHMASSVAKDSGAPGTSKSERETDSRVFRAVAESQKENPPEIRSSADIPAPSTPSNHMTGQLLFQSQNQNQAQAQIQKQGIVEAGTTELSERARLVSVQQPRTISGQSSSSATNTMGNHNAYSSITEAELFHMRGKHEYTPGFVKVPKVDTVSSESSRQPPLIREPRKSLYQSPSFEPAPSPPQGAPFHGYATIGPMQNLSAMANLIQSPPTPEAQQGKARGTPSSGQMPASQKGHPANMPATFLQRSPMVSSVVSTPVGQKQYVGSTPPYSHNMGASPHDHASIQPHSSSSTPSNGSFHYAPGTQGAYGSSNTGTYKSSSPSTDSFSAIHRHDPTQLEYTKQTPTNPTFHTSGYPAATTTPNTTNIYASFNASSQYGSISAKSGAQPSQNYSANPTSAAGMAIQSPVHVVGQSSNQGTRSQYTPSPNATHTHAHTHMSGSPIQPAKAYRPPPPNYK